MLCDTAQTAAVQIALVMCMYTERPVMRFIIGLISLILIYLCNIHKTKTLTEIVIIIL